MFISIFSFVYIYLWFDDVREDLRILKVKVWRSTGMDRDAWSLLVQEAKAHNGL
jgi:hypothetical protein